MKPRNKGNSTVETSESLTIPSARNPNRRNSRFFDEIAFSPVSIQTQRSQPINKRLKKTKKSQAAVKVLAFKSDHRPKKTYKFKVYKETQVLSMNRKLKNKLIETPEADFDCPSDDELIQDIIKQKRRELQGMLVKPSNLC